MNARKLILAVLAAALLLAGCAPGRPAVPPEPTPEPVQRETPAEPIQPAPEVPVGEESYAVNPAQIAATNGMGFELLRQVDARIEAGQNLFLSPASVALALAMTANGAAGDTHAAMLAALSLPGWDDVALNEAMAGLQQALAGELGVELAIANSLWGREGIPFRQEFLDVNRRYYAARVETLDFDDPAAPATINAWVKEQTRGRIEEIVPQQIDPETILYLINAIYFKGDWQTPFRAEATREQPFTRADGTQVQAPLMSRDGRYLYGEGRDYQIVRLPYRGERLGLVLVLPAEDRSLDALVASLDAQTWSTMLAGMSLSEGLVALPRFTFSFGAVLNDPLKAMGMEIAFDKDVADFSRMHQAPWPTWISQVRHKSFVEVNEKGTEAAAVTAVEVQAESMLLDRFTLVADRPFLFAIHDQQTDSVLFLGLLRDPLQTESQAS